MTFTDAEFAVLYGNLYDRRPEMVPSHDELAGAIAALNIEHSRLILRDHILMVLQDRREETNVATDGEE